MGLSQRASIQLAAAESSAEGGLPMRVCTRMAVVAALALVGGCNKGQTHGSGSDAADRKVSAAVMNLVLPDNSQIEVINFEITGPASFSRMGMVNVTNSSLVRFRVGNIPINPDPYTIAISAMTTDGVQCSGSHPFTISNPDFISITMELLCENDNDPNGDLVADVDVNGNCPIITGIDALPAEVFVGSTLDLHSYDTSEGTAD